MVAESLVTDGLRGFQLGWVRCKRLSVKCTCHSKSGTYSYTHYYTDGVDVCGYVHVANDVHISHHTSISVDCSTPCYSAASMY